MNYVPPDSIQAVGLLSCFQLFALKVLHCVSSQQPGSLQVQQTSMQFAVHS